MPDKFLDNVSRCLAVRKELNVAVPQAVKTYLIAVSVCDFNSRYR